MPEVFDRVAATGGRFRNPSLRVEPERQPGAPLQAVYVDLTLQQFTEQNQPAGIMVFAVKVTLV